LPEEYCSSVHCCKDNELDYYRLLPNIAFSDTPIETYPSKNLCCDNRLDDIRAEDNEESVTAAANGTSNLAMEGRVLALRIVLQLFAEHIRGHLSLIDPALLLVDFPASYVSFCGNMLPSTNSNPTMFIFDWVSSKFRVREVFEYSFPLYWINFCCFFSIVVIHIPALLYLGFRLYARKTELTRSKKVNDDRLKRIENKFSQTSMEPGWYYRSKARIASVKVI